jgi:hypothetical protein
MRPVVDVDDPAEVVVTSRDDVVVESPEVVVGSLVPVQAAMTSARTRNRGRRRTIVIRLSACVS